MDASIRTAEDLGALDELIESHVKTLFQMLSREHTLDEVKAEVASLNDLLYAFSRRNELILKLLDGATPDDRRQRIIETLMTMRLKNAANNDELVRLRNKSNELIKKASGLVARAQNEIDRSAHLHAGYSFEACGLCKGLRYTDEGHCAACKGGGTVLVRQPSRKCIRCKGDGVERSEVRSTSRLCAICSGTGWALSIKKHKENRA